MQRAVAIALAGGLLAASAGAFGLAQVLKLERSPIEAIQVDPTPNHGRGQLDRHDSALFSPRCTAPCLPAAQVRFTVHTSGPVRAEVVAAGGAVVRDLGAHPAPGRPGGRALGRPRRRGRRRAGGLLPPAGAPLGPHDRAAQPARAGHGACGVLGTNVSRRVISPDCDSHGDRVTVVVRGREQLAGLQLQVRQTTLEGTRLIRTVRLRKRARALAISWPPYAGKRCTTAPDGRFQLRVIARDVPGNTRAFDLGPIVARGVAITLPERAVVAGRRLRVGISADARSLRLDLTRAGAATAAVLARGVHAPSATRAAPGEPRGRALRRQQPPRRAHVAGVARGPRRAAGARRAARRRRRPPRRRRPISSGWTRSGSASTSTRRARRPQHGLSGYRVVVEPPGTGPRRSRGRRWCAASPASRPGSARDPGSLRARRRRRPRRAADARRPPRAARRAAAHGRRHARAARLGRRRAHVARACAPSPRPGSSSRSRSASSLRGRSRRWPLALPFAACAAAPFRFPVHIGSQDANLLVPLYAVIGVAFLALVARHAARQRARAPAAAAARAPDPAAASPGRPRRWPGARARRRAPRRSAFYVLPFGVLLAALVAHPPPRPGWPISCACRSRWRSPSRPSAPTRCCATTSGGTAS